MKDAIGSFSQAEMEASLQFNLPAYANAIVATSELTAMLGKAA